MEVNNSGSRESKIQEKTLYQITGRPVASGGAKPQFLAEQLTLYQPGGADYAHHSTTSPPPDFQTLRWPWN